MIRAIIAALAVALSTAALAQDGAGGGAPVDPVAVAVDRVRADFNARLVDYDQRIRDLGARVAALESVASRADRGEPPLPADAVAAPSP